LWAVAPRSFIGDPTPIHTILYLSGGSICFLAALSPKDPSKGRKPILDTGADQSGYLKNPDDLLIFLASTIDIIEQPLQP
jgi:hypothetical protein